MRKSASFVASLHASRRRSLIRRCIVAIIVTTVVVTASLPFYLVPTDVRAVKRPGKRSTPGSIPDYHIVFSTSCTDQQNWESYVFFYHCRRVRQLGNVTRLASGCSYEQALELQTFHDTYIAPLAIHSVQRFMLHLTPDFSRIAPTESYKQPYKYYNKPFGLLHWMEHELGLQSTADKRTITSPYFDAGQQNEHQNLLDGIVILMDPDMILLRPIGHDFGLNHEQWIKKPTNTKVTHGHPIAQQDGYLSSEWMKLNFTYITGNTSILPPKWNEGPVHWNTGPPYLATVKDMYQIALLWTEVAPRVLNVYPHLFAEMYGFIIATVMLNLPFALTKSIVVSTTETSNREGWSLVDALEDHRVCLVPKLATSESSPSALPILPIALHYCKRYMLGKSMFSKYRLKKNIMSCEKSLIKPPPDDLFPSVNYMIAPPRADGKDKTTYAEVRQTISSQRAKREYFMLCGMASAVNEALRFYKRQACGKNGAPAANLNETYTIHDDPTNQ